MIVILKMKEEKYLSYTNFDFQKLNEKFYNFEREEFLSYKSLKDRLSSSEINYERITSEEEFLKKSIAYLTKVSYGLFNFITKEKEPNIKFDYKDSRFYCSLQENFISISTCLLTNSFLPQQIRVDSTLGIIFHEFFHKLFTIKDIAKDLDIPIEKYYESHKEVEQFFVDLSGKSKKSKLLMFIINILEDRRIERLGIEKFPGYGFFFDTTRKVAFFLQKDRVVLNDTLPLILDYIFIYVLLPELKEETEERIENDCLKDYSDISPIFISLTESDSGSSLFNIFNKVKKYLDTLNFEEINTFSEVIKHAQILTDLLEKLLSPEKSIPSYDNIVSTIKEGSSLPNGISEQLSEELIEQLEKLKSDTITEVNEKIEENLRKEFIDKINTSNSVFKKYKHIRLIEEPITSTINKSTLRQAEKLAGDLVKTLGFLEDRINRKEEYFELTEGEIDEEELYSIGYNQNIFYTEENTNGYSLTIGILLDESGSMYSKIEDVLLATLTLTISLKDNKHIDLFIYGHSTTNFFSKEEKEEITLYKYYNSLESFTNIERFANIKARASNIDGFAIQKMGEIMKASKTKRKVLVVVSDGYPNGMNYQGSEAIKHTRQSVVELQQQGFYVIQVCMDNIKESPLMFDNFVEFTNDKNFIKNMKDILSKELEQIILQS